MTPQHWKAVLPVIQAFANGQTIQYKGNGKWMDADIVNFKDNPLLYRIKPATIKSRRYFWQLVGQKDIKVAIWVLGQTCNPESWNSFVKWIDEDWVEHELPTETTS